MKKSFFKRALSIILSASMISMLNVSAFAADEESYVAAISGGDSYTSLEAAIGAADDGDTVELLSDVTVDSVIKIEKAITIDGADLYTVTGTAAKTFEVYADASFEDVTIVNTASKGRCVDTRTNVDLELTNVTLSAVKVNSQPLTVGGSDDGTNVTITDSSIDAGNSGYGIITFVECEITLDNSMVCGYAALYVKSGSENSVINVTNCSFLEGNNVHSGTSNNFGTVVIETSDVTVNVVDSEIASDKTGDASQVLFSLGGNANVTVDVDADSILTTNDGYIKGYEETQSISVPSEYADALTAEGYIVTDNDDGTSGVTVSETGLKAYTIYRQTTTAVDGYYAARFIQMIKKTDLDGVESITYTITDGTNTKTITGTSYFTTVKASGETITADDGYVFIGVIITGIPEASTLTCSMSIQKAEDDTADVETTTVWEGSASLGNWTTEVQCDLEDGVIKITADDK